MRLKKTISKLVYNKQQNYLQINKSDKTFPIKLYHKKKQALKNNINEKQKIYEINTDCEFVKLQDNKLCLLSICGATRLL